MPSGEKATPPTVVRREAEYVARPRAWMLTVALLRDRVIYRPADPADKPPVDIARETPLEYPVTRRPVRLRKMPRNRSLIRAAHGPDVIYMYLPPMGSPVARAGLLT